MIKTAPPAGACSRTRRPERVGGARRRRGFTLTEMLIVVVIIVILISILLPALGGARNTARKAATQSFMSSIHQAISSFKAEQQRLPGYFTVKQVGSDDNIVKQETGGTRGLTYLENALLELGGGVYEDQNATEDTATDPSKPPDLIKVGVGQDLTVIVQRTAIGAKGGPGYLDIPEGYIDMGHLTDGRAGKIAGLKWMPRLIDAWGMPILMWPRDEFAKQQSILVSGRYKADDPSTSAPFYWAGNSGFTNAPSLGHGTQKAQWNDSTLSSNGRDFRWKPILDDMGNPLAQTMAAVIGHPGFPDANSLTDADNGPQPAQALGDVILESAGPDGIYLESDQGKFNKYHYVPDGYFTSGAPPAWTADDTTNYVDKSDDLISSGS